MRIRTVVAMALVLSAMFATPVPAAANHTDTCQSPSTWRTYLGRTYNPTGSVTGVEADIDVGAWATCIGATGADFLYFFVDIGANNGGCQVTGSCLIQFGIVRSPTFGTQYAWAFGGCNGKAAVIEGLGAATTSSHHFKIERDALNVYHFLLDGGQLSISISQNDARVACWTSGDRGADWIMEKSDYGNGFADKTLKSQFDSLRFKVSSWGSIPASSACFDGKDNDFCTDYADGDFDGWTDNGGTLLAPSSHDIQATAKTDGWVGLPWR